MQKKYDSIIDNFLNGNAKKAKGEIGKLNTNQLLEYLSGNKEVSLSRLKSI